MMWYACFLTTDQQGKEHWPMGYAAIGHVRARTFSHAVYFRPSRGSI